MAGSASRKSSRNKRRPTASGKSGRTAANRETALDRLLLAVRSDPQDLEAALVLAEYYNADKLEDKIRAVLEPLSSVISSADLSQRRRFYHLLAFAFVRDRRFVDAERIIERGMKDSPDSIDLFYALTFLKLSLGEHDECIAAGKRYLSLLNDIDPAVSVTNNTATEGHRSQLLNVMATAYRASTRFDDAVEAFENSIEADPGNHLPFLNLANMYLQRKRPDTAEKVVNRGLKSCRQGQELRMVLQACRRKTTISACMMVKNEEEMLEDCLKSVRDWVDEIIVVDTGSSDRTVEIAESFGARIFHQPWEGSFSKHRNYSIDQATCDWVFIIDADERVFEEDVPQILNLLNEGEHSFISVNVLNVYGKTEEYTTFLPSERFFKRELNFRYKGIVHNQLEVPRHIKALRTGIRIKHYGYGLEPEKMKKKLARSRSLLEKQLEENQDNAFARFNLSQILRVDLADHPDRVGPEILEHSGRAVELTDPNKNREKHIHLMCLDQLAWACFHLDRLDEAAEYCERALSIKSNYLDPLLLLGHISGKKEEYESSIEHYKRYLRIQAEYEPSQELTNIILFHVDSRAVAFYTMATIYHMTGRTDLARENYRKTLDLNPGYLEANSRLGRIMLENGEAEEAEKLFLRQFEEGIPCHEAALGLAAIYNQQSEFEKAEKYYKVALEEKPDDGVALLKLGRLYATTDRSQQAKECFERASRQGAADPAVDRELAASYFGMGLYSQAAEVYERLVSGGQGDAEVMNDLGNCHFRQGEFKQAEDSYQKALEFSPPLGIVYRNLGVTRARLDKPKEAIRDLERYLTVSPEEHQLWQVIGDLYARIGNIESAIRLYEKYLQHHPDDPLALFSLSEAYLRMGHTDSALLGYRRVLQIDPHFKPAQDRLNSLPAEVGRA